MRKLLFTFMILVGVYTSFGQEKYEEDFNVFWETIDKEYAYFDQKLTDWKKVRSIYSKRLELIKKDWEFLAMIELMKHELYDPHFTLNQNLDFSFRLIPNDLDAYVEVKNDQYFIADIRQGYTIEERDIRLGDQVIAINGQKIQDVIQWNLPASIENPNHEVKEYFANSIFAGRHNKPRVVTIKRNGKTKNIELSKATPKNRSQTLLNFELLANDIGYIRINNSLGNNDLIKLFPKVVDSLSGAKSIVIDLRETHNGGNAEVAKAIMGKFIKTEMPYQVHERVGLEREFGIKRKYIELLFPLENPYTKPVFILVSRWTGSVGEAIAQGFSNIETATVIGTKMAQLLGAINCRRLAHSQINFCYPFEKLYNTDGTPREHFTPDVVSNSYKETYQKALKLIHEKR